MAIILSVSPETFPQALPKVKQCLAQGGVLAVGTESFYGLAANALDPLAVARVAKLKGREPDKPILVLISDRSHLKSLVEKISPAAEILMNRFWPGPLTLVFPARVGLPSPLVSHTFMVGVRLPALAALQSVLKESGPLTGTSANRSGEPPACSALEVKKQLGGEIDLILDTGPSPGGLPTTVVSVDEPITVLRPGLVPKVDLETVLGSHGYQLHGLDEPPPTR